jgi:hypothetical protein
MAANAASSGRAPGMELPASPQSTSVSQGASQSPSQYNQSKSAASVTKSKGSKPTSKPSTLRSFLDTYLEARDLQIPIAKLRWDREMNEGQVRRLREDRVQELMQDVIQNPSGKPAQIVVWNRQGMFCVSCLLLFNCDIVYLHLHLHVHLHLHLHLHLHISDGTYVVLGGQHIAAAVDRVRQLQIEQGYTLKDYLQHVKADVVRFDVDVHTRELIAGRHNQLQHNTVALSLSQQVELLLKEMTNQTGEDLRDVVLQAVEKAGLRNTQTSNVCYHSVVTANPLPVRRVFAFRPFSRRRA